MSSTTTPPAGAPAPSPSPAPATGKTASSPAPAPSGGAGSGGGGGTTTTKKKTTKKKAAASGGDGGSGGGTKTKKPVKRRKAPTKSSGSAASNAAMLAAAKTATADLAQSRALSAARRTDPLWYRIEDVLPPSTTAKHQHGGTGAGGADPHDHIMASSASTVLPEQIQIVEAALAHNNMTRSDVTPQAMACLLEQARRYAQELLEDAQDYAAHAGGMYAPVGGGKGHGSTGGGTGGSGGSSSTAATAAAVATTPSGMPDPAPRDYLLAAEMRPDHPQAVTAELPKLNLLAQQVNGTPLPPIPPQCYSGVLLPPAPHVLTARTFDVVSGAHVAQKMIQAAPTQTKAFAGSMMMTTSDTKAGSGGTSSGGSGTKTSKSGSNKPGYGASRGPQIPINLKKNENKEDSTKAGGGTAAIKKEQS